MYVRIHVCVYPCPTIHDSKWDKQSPVAVHSMSLLRATWSRQIDAEIRRTVTRGWGETMAQGCGDRKLSSVSLPSTPDHYL